MTARLDVIVSKNPSTSEEPLVRHPLGTKARVLLSSVFGPYGQDDEYGSRKMNPMELYHNQVTRTQGPFSLRMFHRSWGLMLIQANIEAPCTLPGLPHARPLHRRASQTGSTTSSASRRSFPTSCKVKKMCELIRQYQPNATIVIGGHIANVPDLDERIDADHIVRGEGVRWFRALPGRGRRPAHAPPADQLGHRHADRWASTFQRTPRRRRPATLIPSVGCPLGCNFCSTSAMFGGKGNSVNFYETGDELFDVMCQLEKEMGVQSFFMMDENFLLPPHAGPAAAGTDANSTTRRGRSTSSARPTCSAPYTIDQLVRLGLSWVWMGIEGKQQPIRQSSIGIDTSSWSASCKSHGIRVLGSTIIGLENHTPENIDEAIDHAVRHDTDFHQFMLYTPIPGTPLCASERQGRDAGRGRNARGRHARATQVQLPPPRHSRW